MSIPVERVAELTIEQLREIIREEIANQKRLTTDLLHSDLSDFPVDHYGSFPEDVTLRREDMYGDDER